MVFCYTKWQEVMPSNQILIAGFMSVRLCEHKVKFMLENEKDYDFPEFIKQIRKCLGRSRTLVSEDTGIAHRTLCRIEAGEFAIPPLDKIGLLAKYYKVSRNVLSKKCKEYLARKKDVNDIILRVIENENYCSWRANQSMQA